MVSWLRANKQSSSLAYTPLARRPRQRHEKWFEKLQKNHPKSKQKYSKIDSKLIQNRSNIGSKWAQSCCWGPGVEKWSPRLQKTGPQAPKNWSIWRPSWGEVGIMLAENLIFGGPGWRPKTTMISSTLRDPLRTDFGAIWGSKIEPKSVQDRTQERS